MKNIYLALCLSILYSSCFTPVEENACNEELLRFYKDIIVNDTVYAPYNTFRTVNMYSSKNDSTSRLAYHRVGANFKYLSDTVGMEVDLGFIMPLDDIHWASSYFSHSWHLDKKADGNHLYTEGIHSATVSYWYRKNKNRYKYEGTIEDHKLLQDYFRIRDADCDVSAYRIEMLIPEVTVYRRDQEDSLHIQNIKFHAIVQ